MEQFGGLAMIYELSNNYYVRALQESDLDGPYSSWFEDLEVCKYNSHGKFAKTADYFRSFFNSLNSEDQVVWAICHKTDGHIGNISLQGLSFINRNAEFAILMGDRRHWHRGVALAAGKKLLHHGFSKLNLERIYCGTAATNIGMRNLAERLGMIQEGCRRNHLFLDGEWVDMLEYGILKKELPAEVSETR
jgi:ribosomal-protein-alanine N-acetyltransferase